MKLVKTRNNHQTRVLGCFFVCFCDRLEYIMYYARLAWWILFNFYDVGSDCSIWLMNSLQYLRLWLALLRNKWRRNLQFLITATSQSQTPTPTLNRYRLLSSGSSGLLLFSCFAFMDGLCTNVSSFFFVLISSFSFILC